MRQKEFLSTLIVLTILGSTPTPPRVPSETFGRSGRMHWRCWRQASLGWRWSPTPLLRPGTSSALGRTRGGNGRLPIYQPLVIRACYWVLLLFILPMTFFSEENITFECVISNKICMDYKKPIVLAKSRTQMADCSRKGPCGRPSCSTKPSGKH